MARYPQNAKDGSGKGRAMVRRVARLAMRPMVVNATKAGTIRVGGLTRIKVPGVGVWWQQGGSSAGVT